MPSAGGTMGMWTEARRQEKMIRGAMVDYRKRAERRSLYYEKIKQDPAQFLRVHGQKIKLKLDCSEAEKAQGPAVMQPWQGDSSMIIDRFDARTFLDKWDITESSNNCEEEDNSSSYTSSSSDEDGSGKRRKSGDGLISEESGKCAKSYCNYERYRTLIQNEYMGVDESSCLKQIYIEEELSNKQQPNALSSSSSLTSDKSVKGSSTNPVAGGGSSSSSAHTPKAAIGYNYEKNQAIILGKHSFKNDDDGGDLSGDSDDESDDSFDEIDLEVTLDIDKLDHAQQKMLSSISMLYGLNENSFLRYLAKDKQHQENLRLAKMLEDEKALYSGRKSRHKRREFHDEKVLMHRKFNPKLELSYVSKDNNEDGKRDNDVTRDRSKSTSSKSTEEEDTAPKFITSFDVCQEDEKADKSKNSKSKKKSKKIKRNKSSSSSDSRSTDDSAGLGRSKNEDRKRKLSASHDRRRSYSKRRSHSRSSNNDKRHRKTSRDNRYSRYSRDRSRSRSYHSRYRNRRKISNERRRYSPHYSSSRHRSRRSRSLSKARYDRELNRVSRTRDNAKSRRSAMPSKLPNNKTRDRSSSDSSLEKLRRPKLNLQNIIQNSASVDSELTKESTNRSNNENTFKRYRRQSLSSNSELDTSPSPPPTHNIRKPPLPPLKPYNNFSFSKNDTTASDKPTALKASGESSNNATNSTGGKKVLAVERMKRLMEKQLNKQIKADKQVRAIKDERKFQQQLEWEEHQKSMNDMWLEKEDRRRGSGGGRHTWGSSNWRRRNTSGGSSPKLSHPRNYVEQKSHSRRSSSRSSDGSSHSD